MLWIRVDIFVVGGTCGIVESCVDFRQQPSKQVAKLTNTHRVKHLQMFIVTLIVLFNASFGSRVCESCRQRVRKTVICASVRHSSWWGND